MIHTLQWGYIPVYLVIGVTSEVIDTFAGLHSGDLSEFDASFS